MTDKPEREHEIKLLSGPSGLDVHGVRKTAEALGIALGEGRVAPRRDVYLDDAGFHLGRSGIGLRVRETARGASLELKVDRGRSGRVHRRDELACELENGLPPRARDLPRALRDRVEPFVYDGPLRTAVVLRVERATHRASMADADALVCVDRVAVESPYGDAIGDFEELEIEIPPHAPTAPWLRWADALRSDLGLGESPSSKLQRALELARTDAGARPVRIDADLDLREAAMRTVERHLRRMQQHEVRVRTSDKPEAVHKLRVACRRMRATFEIFAGCFVPGEVDGFVGAARRTARAFNDVRDLDVLTLRLERDLDRLPASVQRAARRWIRRLRRGRTELFKDGRKKLGKSKRLRSCAALQTWLEKPRRPTDGVSVADGAPELVWQAAREVFAMGAAIRRDSHPERLHELRLATKRLRYTAEAFKDVYGRDLMRFVERTTHLQEVLGAHQDAVVGVSRLAALVGLDGLSKKELVAIGAWMALEHDRGRRAREAFEAVWAEFDTDDLRTYLGAALRARA